jgi:hypothetical protein
MDDKCNTGGTHFEDANGNEISEQEHQKILKKQTATAKKTAGDEKEVVTDVN